MIKENIGTVSTFSTGTVREAPIIVLPSNHYLDVLMVAAYLLVWPYLLKLNKSGGHHRAIHITERFMVLTHFSNLSRSFESLMVKSLNLLPLVVPLKIKYDVMCVC